jgi:peptidoglycan/xylan/chitin deacetylase (PgdA/CDA1 family)
LTVTVHPLSAGRAPAPGPDDLVPSSGPLPVMVARVSGPEHVLNRAGDGLPEGAARAEAVAVRARREGAELRWGAADRVDDLSALITFCRDRGRSAVEMARVDPLLILETQIGTWFESGCRSRLARRSALSLPVRLRSRLLRDPNSAFWSGVRSAATKAEWQRLTRNSYVALLYHRLAGEGKSGQEKLDIDPKRFAAHLRLLRRLGFRALAAEDLVAFHRGELGQLRRRTFALTLDDGTADCAEPLLDAVFSAPQLFVPTAELGGRAHWLDGEVLLSWDDVAALTEAGVGVGSHASRHRRLTELAPNDLTEDLAGSMADLRAHLSSPLPIVAYPHGSNDEIVRRAAADAHFEVAYSTLKGRNGLATNRYALRRVSVYGYDGRLAVLWKATTGEAIPPMWERWRSFRLGVMRRFRKTPSAV